MLERTPPKFYNASEDFDCTFVSFCNSHSKYCYNALLQEVTRLCEGNSPAWKSRYQFLVLGCKRLSVNYVIQQVSFCIFRLKTKHS